MHRVVLDTNVVLSAMLTNCGPASVVLGLVLSRRLAMVVSEQVLDEYEEVLSRSRFGIDPRDRAVILERVRRVGHAYTPQALPGGKKGFPDPADIMFLELALGGRADWLITRNVKHFPPQRCGFTSVVTPEQIVGKIDL